MHACPSRSSAARASGCGTPRATLSRRARRHRRVRTWAMPSAAHAPRCRATGGKLVHTSNLYEIPLQEALGDRLCAISGMDSVFFCNSGCEANEAAIKLARLYGHKQGIEAPAIIVMEKAFHGRTIATLTATGSRKVQAGFEPLLSRIRARAVRRSRSGATRRREQPQRRRGAGRADPGRRRHQHLPAPIICTGCARSATRTAGCSCSTKCRAAPAAPASGSRYQHRASSPTS